MAEKESPDFVPESRDDYDDKKASETFEPELVEETGRRQSVALNIIENPLKVSVCDNSCT